MDSPASGRGAYGYHGRVGAPYGGRRASPRPSNGGSREYFEKIDSIVGKLVVSPYKAGGGLRRARGRRGCARGLQCARGCRGHRSKSGDQEGTQRFQSGKVRAGREAGKKHGGQHRGRNGIFVRGVFGVAAIGLRSATIVRCACSRSTAPSSRQSGMRMAIMCNVERSAVLRRVEVCCTLSSAIAIVLRAFEDRCAMRARVPPHE